MPHPFFEGKQILLASMHRKEEALSSFVEELGATLHVVGNGFNSDVFGTFSGEIERKLSVEETLFAKAKAAHQLSGMPLVLVSEGSFGPHPHYYVVPADNECLALYDFENGYTWSTSYLSTDTNFAQQTVSTISEAMQFAEKVLFPSHGLIARCGSHIEKGIRSVEALKTFFEIHQGREIHLETDMRAMHNPSRMQVIRLAMKQLVDQLHICCPSCQLPGFIPTQFISGLPCSSCGTPSRFYKEKISICQRCGYEQIEKISGHIDPSNCEECNP